MPNPPSLRVAVDIGGTFTDVAVAGPDGALAITRKTPTTPDAPSRGAFHGVAAALDAIGANVGDVDSLVHGTTLATNALLERRGARVATIATRGFRDILEIAYERRYSQYDLFLEKPDLLVPRARSFTIAERVRADGAVLTPLDESEIDRLVAELDACEAEAVAICLLHAYANPAHERRLAALLSERRPDIAISISSDVSPEAREFERLCTTVANAYVQPLIAGYLAQFQTVFAEAGLSRPIMMMTSGGGMTTVETARRLPIRLVESGPSGGAVLAARTAAALGADRVLSFDMGGTTAKLCLIDDQQPQTTRLFEVSRAARFIKGSGMPVRIPVVDMIEIGAGGGSIAGVDRLGRITVGPKSAGASPGPAAFGRGGDQPTVTDADALLGYLADGPIGDGELTVDSGRAAAALDTVLGAALGAEAIEAADGVSAIVDETMASAARMHAVETGKDLGARLMIAFGGNGPLHATRVARRAGVAAILIPRDPSVGSAVGFLAAPISYETVRTKRILLEELAADAVNAHLDAMADEALGIVRRGAGGRPISIERSAFMRYRGQGHEIEVSLPDRPLIDDDRAMLTAAFARAYADQFARAVPGMAIEALNWRVLATTEPDPPSPAATAGSHRTPAPSGRRSIICDATGEPTDAAVYERSALSPGDRLPGPALVVEPHTTTLVSVDFHAEVDAAGNLRLTRVDP